MCFGSGSAPAPANIAAPPAPSQAPFQIERTKEKQAFSDGAPKADIRKFDLGLPASFQIPR